MLHSEQLPRGFALGGGGRHSLVQRSEVAADLF